MKRLFIVLAVMLSIVITGCGSNDSTPAPLSSEKASTAVSSASPSANNLITENISRQMDLMEESRMKSANSAIAEVQARASNVYAGNMMNNISPNDCATVFSAVNSSIGGTLGDFTVVLTSNCPSGFTITVTAIKGKLLTTPQIGSWTFPQN